MLPAEEVTIEEKRLLDFLRELAWGEATVKVKNGVPVLISEARRDVKLTD